MRVADGLNNFVKDLNLIHISHGRSDRCESAGRSLSRLAASLAYWLIAHSHFLPDLYIQRYSTQSGLSRAARRPRKLPTSLIYRLSNGTLEPYDIL
jgi:hypothetical protein